MFHFAGMLVHTLVTLGYIYVVHAWNQPSWWRRFLAFLLPLLLMALLLWTIFV